MSKNKNSIKTSEIKIGDKFYFKMTKKLRMARLEMAGAKSLADSLTMEYIDYNKSRRRVTLREIGDLRLSSSKRFWKLMYKIMGIEHSAHEKFVFTVNWHDRYIFASAIHPEWRETKELTKEETK